MRDFRIDLIWTKLQIAVTVIGGWLGYVLGGMDNMLHALIILMVIDYITGVMRAFIERRLSSAIGFKGLFKKMLVLIMVAIANIIDVHIVGSGSALRSATVCFYSLNEILSVTEHAAAMGLPIPGKLKDALEQLHKGNKGTPEQTSSQTDNTKETQTDNTKETQTDNTKGTDR